MKFIIDNAISPVVAELLQGLGYDTIHVRDIGLQSASDSEIFKSAEDQNRIIVSADTDFGTLLALWNKSRPLVILFRHDSNHRPRHQFSLLKANLPNITQALETGSIVIIEKKAYPHKTFAYCTRSESNKRLKTDHTRPKAAGMAA